MDFAKVKQLVQTIAAIGITGRHPHLPPARLEVHFPFASWGLL